MNTNRAIALTGVAGLAVLGASGASLGQCMTGLFGGMRYGYSQNHSMSMTFSLYAAEWEGRIDSGKGGWSGGMGGRAVHGGRDFPGDCDPANSCYCDYATDYPDGDAINEGWEPSASFEFNDPSDYYSFVQEGDYANSSANGANVNLGSTRGGLNADRWSFNLGSGQAGGEGEYAYVENSSGSYMTGAIGSNRTICFNGCEGDYSYYVGYASGKVETKEHFTVLLGKGPNDPNLWMNLHLSANAGYSTTFIDAVPYGQYCIGGHADYYAAVPITCIGTPQPLSMTTKVELTVQLVKRDAGGAVPTSVIESWDFSGSYTTTPFAFSASGYFDLMYGNEYSAHAVSNSEDLGLPAGTQMSESWNGSGWLDEYIQMQYEIAEPCALIITRKTSIGSH